MVVSDNDRESKVGLSVRRCKERRTPIVKYQSV